MGVKAAARHGAARTASVPIVNASAAWRRRLCFFVLRRFADASTDSSQRIRFGFAVQRHRVSSLIELAKPLTHPDVEGRKDLALFAELALAF